MADLVTQLGKSTKKLITHMLFSGRCDALEALPIQLPIDRTLFECPISALIVDQIPIYSESDMKTVYHYPDIWGGSTLQSCYGTYHTLDDHSFVAFQKKMEEAV